MKDEQRSLTFFQEQPEGLVLIFHSSVLSLAHMEQSHRAHRDGKNECWQDHQNDC